MSWTLITSSYSSGRVTDASRSSRRAGGPEAESNIAVDTMADADDTSNQPNLAATLGACPRPDQGEVQGLCQPSPRNHRGIAARATFSSLEAAPKGDGQSQHRVGGRQLDRKLVYILYNFILFSLLLFCFLYISSLFSFFVLFFLNYKCVVYGGGLSISIIILTFRCIIGCDWLFLLRGAIIGSVVRAFAHGAMDRRIDPTWSTH